MKPAPMELEIDYRKAPGTDILPDNLVWMCGACGKRSRSRYGFDSTNKNCCDRGWDESCMVNAALYYTDEDDK